MTVMTVMIVIVMTVTKQGAKDRNGGWMDGWMDWLGLKKEDEKIRK